MLENQLFQVKQRFLVSNLQKQALTLGTDTCSKLTSTSILLEYQGDLDMTRMWAPLPNIAGALCSTPQSFADA